MIEVDAVLLAVGDLPPTRRGRALSARLQAAVRSGQLPAGEVLPGSRTLAVALALSRGTVVAALDELTDLGLLRAEPRRGYRVAELPSGGTVLRLPRPRPRSASPGVGDLSLFPRSAWLRSTRHALGELTHTELGYPDPAGLPLLRETLADYLGRTRGAVVEPSGVVVLGGVSHGVALLAAVGRRVGLTRWFVEDPQPPGLRTQLEHLGVEITLLGVHDDGPHPDGVDGPGFVLLTPNHQAPTGRVMTGARRRAFVERAAAVGAYVVEDDYDGDLPMTRDRRPVLQATDPERVLLVGSVSKALAPGLRLGWFCGPLDWAKALAAERGDLDLGSPVIEQATFAHFLGSGAYDRHLRRARAVYATRRRAVLEALGHHGLQPIDGTSASLQVCLLVPPECVGPAADLEETGPIQLVTGAEHAYLVVGTATILERQASSVVARIATALGGRALR